MKPMSKEEAEKSVSAMEASIEANGMWNMVCVHCGNSCGGQLAEYGKPSPEGPDGIRYVCCPCCDAADIRSGHYDGNEHIRLEFVPAATGGP